MIAIEWKPMLFYKNFFPFHLHEDKKGICKLCGTARRLVREKKDVIYGSFYAENEMYNIGCVCSQEHLKKMLFESWARKKSLQCSKHWEELGGKNMCMYYFFSFTEQWTESEKPSILCIKLT